MNFELDLYRGIFLLISLSALILFLLFAISGIKEKRYRAFGISSLITVLILFISFLLFVNDLPDILFIGIDVFSVIFAMLFFLPIDPYRPINQGCPLEKVDERDTMFARAKYNSGAENYNIYYKLRPDLKTVDDNIRSMPPLMGEKSKLYNPAISRQVDSMFELEGKMVDFVDGDISENKVEDIAENFSRIIKEFAKAQGAGDVGIALLNQDYVYSHAGKGPEEWGSEIKLNHKYAIAYVLEMDYSEIEKAPYPEVTRETAKQYLQAQRISISIANFIRDLGYPARAHISGSNYQVMLPPVAVDAGLGEIGRLGYLVSDKYGPRCRIGLVTTDLPLVPDEPIDIGARHFCELCKKCALNCPSGSIPLGERSVRNGVTKWPLEIESCYKYWRIIGSDCAMCMKVCPYSHPDTFIHKVIKYAISKSYFARIVSNFGDDLFYGKKFRIS